MIHRLFIVLAVSLCSKALSVKLQDVVAGESDGTMASMTTPSVGRYSVAAANPDAYVRFTMPGCYDLKPFAYLRMRAWAKPGVEFTIDLRQGFPDCRLDAWPYVAESASALVSHYTQKGAFDGSPEGQLVYIPLSHFDIDLSKVVQVFVSNLYTLPDVVGAVTSASFGEIEFTNEAPTSPTPNKIPQNPTASSCLEPFTFAVTFDNQYSGNIDRILDVLAKENAKCTIFQIGGELKENDTAMKRAIKEGHQVAAHSWTHRDFDSLSEVEIKQEMDLTDQAMRQRLGIETKWFRPPFGHQDPRVRNILNTMGYISIIWDIDSTDYFNQENAPLIWSRIQARIDNMVPSRAGGVLLLHNDINASADVVQRAVQYAKSKGFTKFVTVESCMNGKFDAFLGKAAATRPAPATSSFAPGSPAPQGILNSANLTEDKAAAQPNQNSQNPISTQYSGAAQAALMTCSSILFVVTFWLAISA